MLFVNRKEIGKWKWHYNNFLDKSTTLLKDYRNERTDIERDYMYEMLIFREDIMRFISYFDDMRDALKMMTKK